jgi:Ecdysteroid kinase-like family
VPGDGGIRWTAGHESEQLLTPAWLTAVLRPAGSQAEVVAVRSRPLGVGVGLLSALDRLELTWAGGTGPQTVVVKRPPASDRTRAVGAALGMYRNEACFFASPAAETAIAIGCHHVQIDEATQDFLLVLDDMGDAAVVDQVAGCPPDRAAETVAAMADHHAAFWDEAGLGGEGWLRPIDDPAFVQPLRDAYRQAWPGIRERFGPTLPAGAVTAGDRLFDRIPALAAALAAPPRTLSHGDFRLDNMFFAAGGRLRVCDWQLVDRSRGMRDLAYFLSQSLEPEVRAEVEGLLIELYLKRLADHGISGYSGEEAWRDYRTATLFGFLYPVVAGEGLDLANDRSSLFTEVILRRSAAAVVDLGGPDLAEAGGHPV